MYILASSTTPDPLITSGSRQGPLSCK